MTMAVKTRGLQEATFRGRLLVGRPTKLQHGCHGLVVEEDKLGLEIASEFNACQVLKATGTFDEMTVWGHDFAPTTASEPLLGAVEEWSRLSRITHQQLPPPSD
ncbi:hypothetical protein GQ42DRAFT_6354 [Ramicandelaber brevisporus]|nr:hypothetical protein GQ42DRAFT_6354 [Ramicandelaber brevisporus]